MKKHLQRFFAVLTAAAAAVLCTLAVGAEPQRVLLGDADRNGKIESADARFTLRCAVGLEISGEVDLLICDVDLNGEIEAADARLILRVAVGLDSFNGKSYPVWTDSPENIKELLVDPGFVAHAGDYYLKDSEKVDNARLIFKILSDFGWSRNAICAALGNMEWESTLNPGIKETAGTGYGLAQWTPGTKYTDWAQENNFADDSMDGQLFFLNWTMQPECPGEYKMWYSVSAFDLTYDQFITSAEPVAFLTEAFMRNYERPSERSAHLSNRITYAEKWDSYFSRLGL